MSITTINATVATNYTMIGLDYSSYANARATSTFVGGANNGYVGQDFDPTPYWICRRIALKFDTSSIKGTVVSAYMKLSITNDTSTTDFNLNIAKADWSAYDPLVDANKDNIYDIILAADTDVIWRNTSGISTGIYYSSPNLDKTRINQLGSTYYGLINANEKNNVAPTNQEFIKIDFVTLVPQLVVEYNDVMPPMWFM